MMLAQTAELHRSLIVQVHCHISVILNGLRTISVENSMFPLQYAGTGVSIATVDYILFGASPSGKARVFGIRIRRFESYRPSQNNWRY